jgi:transcriptional regulator with XRE-family HTH domain
VPQLIQSRELLKQMQADRIGRRIREIRGFNLTQAEFGRILGVGQMQLSKYERSERADAGGASETKSSLGQEHRLYRDRLRRWSVKT